MKLKRLSVNIEETKTETTDSDGNKSPQSKVLRRRSTWRGLSQSLTGMLRMRRMTKASSNSEPQKPKIRYENTYKTAPDHGKTFCPRKVNELVNEILERELRGETYVAPYAGRTACNISNIIKNEIKQLNIPRHKFVCQVILSETKGQDIEAASKCLWDEKTDNFVCASYTNGTMAAVATVHAVYFE